MISLDQHFQQFLRERTYLVNATPKPREWYETAWKRSSGLKQQHHRGPRTRGRTVGASECQA